MIAQRAVWVAVLALGAGSCGPAARPARFNSAADLTGKLPDNPLRWKPITSSSDRVASTMSILYGNDDAVAWARRHSQPDYPAGSVLALVTWTQQNDAQWFGATMPGHVRSVEFVRVTPGAGSEPAYSYEDFCGAPLVKTEASNGRVPGSRAAYLLSLRAAVLP